MKTLKLFLLIFCCFTSTSIFAQTPAAIEKDLLKEFKKIDDWSNDTTISANESLWNAKKTVGEKLFYYTSTFPATITYPFNLLKKEHVDINTSDDGRFRIYSWDTWTGGTMHFFESVFQYKEGNRTRAVLDTVKHEGDSRPNYRKLYTLKVGSNIYYLAVYLFIESSRYYGEGVQCFSILQGKLDEDIKIIKTRTGLHSQLDYEADLGSVVNIPYNSRPTIYFDAATQTIHLPLVEAGGKVTRRYITYKFTGKYFEKVKP